MALIESRDTEGCTPLSWAAQESQIEVVKLLLDRRSLIDIPNEQGRTPLSLGALSGHTVIAQLLFGKGALVHSRDNRCWTCMYLASRGCFGTNLTASILLSAGANPNANNQCGEAPLFGC